VSSSKPPTDARSASPPGTTGARDKYVSEYERRSVLKSGGHDLRVWAQTPAYKRCTADDAASCLEAAVLEVDRINVY
jgi:hypothetical protein